MFDELGKVVTACHFIYVDDSLDKVVSISIVALQSQEFSNSVETVYMLGVHLTELEKGVDIV